MEDTNGMQNGEEERLSLIKSKLQAQCHKIGQRSSYCLFLIFGSTLGFVVQIFQGRWSWVFASFMFVGMVLFMLNYFYYRAMCQLAARHGIDPQCLRLADDDVQDSRRNAA